jgi:two-component system OmpR family sensor kinase
VNQLRYLERLDRRSARRRKRRLPLRYTLLGGMIALTALALAAVGVTSVLAVRSDLLRQIDDQLHLAGGVARQRVAALRGLDPLDAGLREVIAPSEYVVELSGSDGPLRVSGPERLPTGALLRHAPAPPPDGSVSHPSTVPDGSYRVVSVRASGIIVVVGLPLAPVDRTVTRLAVTETVAGLGVLALLAGSGWLLLVTGLRPLEEITATAAAIADGDLDRRLPRAGPAGRSEVGRLTVAVNGMLARIQGALAARARSEQRMRDFVADASHELRTPLTAIRGYLQLLRHNMVSAQDRPDALRRADEESVRMATLVDDLLYLARLDAEPALRHEPVELTVVVRDCIADALAVQPGRVTTLHAPPSCVVSGDRDGLHQVMTNLLANVRAHTPANAAVSVEVAVNGSTARVAVRDTGPGMAPDVAARAFDRFARAGTGRGSGLGLAIVAEIVAAHGGEAGIESEPGAGTTVTFTVPVADS